MGSIYHGALTAVHLRLVSRALVLFNEKVLIKYKSIFIKEYTVKIRNILAAVALSLFCSEMVSAASEQIHTQHRDEFNTYVNPYGFGQANIKEMKTGEYLGSSWFNHMGREPGYAKVWGNKALNCEFKYDHLLKLDDSPVYVKEGNDKSCSDQIGDRDIGADKKWGQGWNNACHVHDHCYATIGKTKEQCDSEFRSNLVGWCNQTTDDPVCQVDAFSYYWAVAALGRQSYNETQTASLVYLKNLKTQFEAGLCSKNAEASNLLYLGTEEAKREVYSWLGFYFHDRNFSKHKLEVKYESPWGFLGGGTWWHDYDGFVYKPNKSLMTIDEKKFNQLKFSENGVFDYLNWYNLKDVWEAELDSTSYSVYLGEDLAFNGASSHGPNGLGDFVYFRWNFGDGAVTYSQPLAGSVTHTYQNRGQYTVVLEAYGSGSNTRKTQANVTVYGFVDVLPAILHLM